MEGKRSREQLIIRAGKPMKQPSLLCVPHTHTGVYGRTVLLLETSSITPVWQVVPLGWMNGSPRRSDGGHKAKPSGLRLRWNDGLRSVFGISGTAEDLTLDQ